jgi:hypothetical protein
MKLPGLQVLRKAPRWPRNSNEAKMMLPSSVILSGLPHLVSSQYRRRAVKPTQGLIFG